MSDLYLNPTADGGELIIENGKPQMTSGLETAVYLSLFTRSWWGNAFGTTSEKHTSKIPEIMESQLLNIQTKLDIIEEAKSVLKWMLDDGLADEITVTAEINKPGVLYLAVKLSQPEEKDNETFKYALNWSAQEVSLI